MQSSSNRAQKKTAKSNSSSIGSAIIKKGKSRNFSAIPVHNYKDIRDFLKKEPTKLHKILSHTKKTLADVAAVNVTRFALLKVLKSTLLRLAQKNRHFDTSTRLRRERSIERSVQCRLSAQSTAGLSIEYGLIQGISHKFCKRIHAKDGYSYAT